MRARKRDCKAFLTPEVELPNTDCFHVLIFNDFEDEQLLDLPTIIEFHGSHTKVEIFVEEGTDQHHFSYLMASVRKAAPHICFKINLKVPIETLNEIERQHAAEGGTVFEPVI